MLFIPEAESVFTTVGALLFALVLLVRLPRIPEARALSYALLCVARLSEGFEYSSLHRAEGIAEGLGLPPALVDGLFGFTGVAGGAWPGVIAFLWFTYLFPRQLAPADLAPPDCEWISRRYVLWREVSVADVRSWLSHPSHLILLAILFPLIGVLLDSGGDPPGVVASVTIGLGFMMGLVFFFTCLANLRCGYRVAGSEERRRILWILGGLVTAAGMVLVGVALLPFVMDEIPFWMLRGMISAHLFSCAPLAVLGGLAVAVFFHGAIDPVLAIRKTTVYSALGVLALFLFAGIGNFVENTVQRMAGLSEGIGSVLAGGIVAVIVIPIKSRIGRLAERWLPGSVEGNNAAESEEAC